MMFVSGLTWMMMVFGSGVGIPVGLPPAPAEEYMFNIAPDECLFFTTWASMAKIDPESENYTERLMAEKQIQTLVAKAEAAFRKISEEQASRGNADSRHVFGKAMPDVTRTILTRATTAFIDDFEIRGDAPHVSGGVVVSLGDQEAIIRKHLDALNKVFAAENKLTTIEIAGSAFTEMKIPEGENLLTWGIHEGRLYFAAGDGSMQKMIERGSTEPPKWLTDLRKELTVERVATVSYIDLKSITGIIKEEMAGGEAAMVFGMMDNFGLTSFKSYRSVSGMEAGGLIDRTAVDLDGERKGLLAAIGNASLKPKSLNKLPKDPLVAVGVQIDLKLIYKMIEEDPSLLFIDRETMNQMIDGVEDVIGADFKDDLIGSLGEAAYLYTAPNDGGLITGWILAIDIDQSMTMDQIMQRVIGFANAAMLVGGDDNVQIKTQIIDGNDVHYVVFRNNFMPFSFSFSLVNDQLLFSLFPQAIKGHIARQKSGEGLLANKQYAAAMEQNDGDGNLSAVSYVDMEELVRLLYPFLVGVSSQLVYADEFGKIGISPADVPAANVIAQHLRPAISTTYADENSYRTTSRHVLPTGNLGSNVPAMAALMLPAVSSAREAAGRTQSANNLKQIGLGMHNYHDVYRGMPPAYNTDAEGKPLLSWRVHILPFTEQVELYQEFHLDEPWDSDHNKPLIEKMPEFLKSPGVKLDEGKTVYVGVAGEGCIFGPESITDKAARDNPVGHSLARMTDGTSNTIMVLEANKDSAVIWTKPDDFEAPGMNPVGRMMGTWGEGTNVLFGDGSVQFINDNIDIENLTNMFRMNDGNPIDRDFGADRVRRVRDAVPTERAVEASIDD